MFIPKAIQFKRNKMKKSNNIITMKCWYLLKSLIAENKISHQDSQELMSNELLEPNKIYSFLIKTYYKKLP